MPQILCTLPNASTLISGVAFSSHPNGMLSEEVSDDVAAGFAGIPGYTQVGSSSAEQAAKAAAEKAAAEAQEAADAAAAESEKASLHERAAKIEFKIKHNWSLDRLRSEVEAAEKAAAEAK